MSVQIKLLVKIFRPEIYKSYLKQKNIRKLSIEEIQKIQWNRLKSLLDYVYKSSDFYRESFETINLKPEDIKSYKDFTKLPFVNKKILKKNYKEIIAKGSSDKDYTVSYTAGSSGEPFPFLLDKKRESPRTVAAYMLNTENVSIDPFENYNQLIIKAEPVNEIKNLYETNKTGRLYGLKYYFIPGTFGIRSSNINKDNIDAITSIINNNNIDRITGYASNVFNLAKLFKMYNVNVKLKYVILIAESLLKQQRDFISKTFQCPVYMDYSASECMRMGFECHQQNGYHLDIYNYYFEFLNDKGELCKPGEVANIIVTNLNNYIFPLIRYRIGDQCIAPKDKCTCGLNYPLVNQLIGRDSEFITTPLHDEIALNDFQVCLSFLYEYISQYQFISDKKNNTIIIKIVPTEKFNSGINKQIIDSILELIKYSMNVNIELVENIPFGDHGKTKLLIIKS